MGQAIYLELLRCQKKLISDLGPRIGDKRCRGGVGRQIWGGEGGEGRSSRTPISTGEGEGKGGMGGQLDLKAPMQPKMTLRRRVNW